MFRKGWTLILCVILTLGLGLVCYPTVSSVYNAMRQSRVVARYEASVREDEYSRQWLQAREYNQRLALENSNFAWSDTKREEFTRLLGDKNVSIGFIEIPSLSLRLPIYLGTAEEVLQSGIGVLEGSSLPVGGESTHTVLSGHRGLPTATLFTHLDRLNAGDVFTLHVLGQSATYAVEGSLVVEPGDVSALAIKPGEDLCTLVTCTPYGINSHRLLVQARRVATGANTAEKIILSNAKQLPTGQVAMAFGLLMLVGLAFGGATMRLAGIAAGILRSIGAAKREPGAENFTHHRKGGNGNEKTT